MEKKFDATYVDETEMFIFLSQLLAFTIYPKKKKPWKMKMCVDTESFITVI